MSYVRPDPFDTPPQAAVPWYRRLFTGQLGAADPAPPRFRGRDRLTDPPWGPRAIEVSDSQEVHIQSPALGDAFVFEVTIHCTWLGRGHELDGRRLQREIRDRQQQVEALFQATVGAITREHRPHACAEVERRINEELSTHSWPVNGGAEITCRGRATVGLDPAIRDMRREAGLRSVQLDVEREATRQQVERLRDQVALWRGLLSEWTSDPTVSDAVVLALRPDELENIAVRPQTMVDPERERLIAEASRWLERTQELEVEEMLFGFDSALRALMRHLGIPPPPPAESVARPADHAESLGDGGQRWDGSRDGAGEAGLSDRDWTSPPTTGP